MDLGSDRHVILIGIVQNSSVPRELPSLQFHLHFHPGWKYMFVDDIWNDSSIPLSQLIDPEVSTMNKVLSVTLFCELVCSKALEIAQRVVISSFVEKLHDQILQVFDPSRVDCPIYNSGYEFKGEKGNELNDEVSSDVVLHGNLLVVDSDLGLGIASSLTAARDSDRTWCVGISSSVWYELCGSLFLILWFIRSLLLTSAAAITIRDPEEREVLTQ